MLVGDIDDAHAVRALDNRDILVVSAALGANVASADGETLRLVVANDGAIVVMHDRPVALTNDDAVSFAGLRALLAHLLDGLRRLLAFFPDELRSAARLHRLGSARIARLAVLPVALGRGRSRLRRAGAVRLRLLLRLRRLWLLGVAVLLLGIATPILFSVAVPILLRVTALL